VRRLFSSRSGAVAFAIQVALVTIGCHEEVARGRVHGWGVFVMLTLPAALWALAVVILVRVWHGPGG